MAIVVDKTSLSVIKQDVIMASTCAMYKVRPTLTDYFDQLYFELLLMDTAYQPVSYAVRNTKSQFTQFSSKSPVFQEYREEFLSLACTIHFYLLSGQYKKAHLTLFCTVDIFS